MITEIAMFTAAEGKEEELGQAILRGTDVIRQHPDCLSVKVERCVEFPARYVLLVTWTSYEAHVQDFRGGPLFPQWRSHINGLFDDAPIVLHYQPIEKE